MIFSRIILTLLTIPFFLTVSAQSETSVEEGISLLKQQKYVAALEKFHAGLSNPGSASADQVSRGYYYQGLAYVGLTRKLLREDNPALQQKYQDSDLKALQSFQASVNANPGQKYAQLSEERLDELKPSVQQSGQSLLAETDRMGLSRSERLSINNLALKYFEVLTELFPTDYINFDLKGQVLLAKADTAAAFRHFVRATELFEQYPPAQPDMLVAYIYYRMAMIQRHFHGDRKKALATIQTGKDMLDKEFQRMQAMRLDLDEDPTALYEEILQNMALEE